MEFESKYNVSDEVWYMTNNKPISVIISSIEISYISDEKRYVKYTARDKNNPVSWLDHTNLFEDMLFESKEKLLKSL